MKTHGAQVQRAAVIALEQLDQAVAAIGERDRRNFVDGPDLRLRVAELSVKLIAALSVYQERFPFSSGLIGSEKEGGDRGEGVGIDPGGSGGNCGAS